MLPSIRRLVSDINKRSAMGCEEMLKFEDLHEFARVMESDAAQESSKVLHLRRQLATLLHQHFRRRWPTALPDWSPEEVARGLDRPTGNRALGRHAVDLRSMGVPYINAAVVPGLPPSPLSYVATQHPLPSTVGDFWRMVLLLHPVAIVMLNGAPAVADAGGDLPEYWLPSSLPSGDSIVLNTIEEGERYDSSSDCIVRMLHCEWRDTEWCGPQLAVSWWHDQSEPNMERFLALESLLDSYVVQKGLPPPPVLVHCAAGIGTLQPR